MSLSAVHEKLDLTQPFDKSDVTFLFDDGKKLHFVRAVLAFHSRVFNEMWDFSEAKSENNEVTLKGVASDEFNTILRLLRRTDTIQLITDGNVAGLLKLADRYELAPIFVDCSAYIVANWQKSPEKHLKAVQLASEFNLKNVAKVFIPLASVRSLADITSAAASLRGSVYAAVLLCRTRRTCALAASLEVRYVLACYPRCLRRTGRRGGSSVFVCAHCKGHLKVCAEGVCEEDSSKLSECACGERAKAEVSLECGRCEKDKVGDGEVCMCEAKPDQWLTDADVDLLLKKG